MNIPHKPVIKTKVVPQTNVEQNSADNVGYVGEKMFRLTSESTGSYH